MTRECLLVMFGPANVLPAVSAVRWFGVMKHGEESANATVLLTPPFSGAVGEEIVQITRRMLGAVGFGDVRVLFLDQMQQLVPSTQALESQTVLEEVRSLLGRKQFTEVYYAHDVNGHGAQLAMRAFPAASHITYGESLGLLVDKDYTINTITGRGWDETKKKARADPQAAYAVLILPFDETGDCLEGKELLVVPLLLAKAVIRDHASDN